MAEAPKTSVPAKEAEAGKEKIVRVVRRRTSVHPEQ
jgi:hypothetical protein